MKLFLVTLAVMSLAQLASPPRAECANCATGVVCYNDGMCGRGCDCLLINGLGQPGICG